MIPLRSVMSPTFCLRAWVSDLMTEAMALHIKKLCVGISSLPELEEHWRVRRRLFAESETPWYDLTTRNTPKRSDEILDGGSLFWIISGQFAARQKILSIRSDRTESGQPVCFLRLDLELFPVLGWPHRPFQGWRYLEHKDAPPDVGGSGGGSTEISPEMAQELAGLGLL